MSASAVLPLTLTASVLSCFSSNPDGGANLYHVKDLLGHETVDTLRHYAKLNVDDLRKTLARCHPRERADQAQP